MGWQPIETAPKTGESILLAHGNSVWIDEWWERDNEWLEVSVGGHQGEVPTYWMPLPDPPTVCEFESCPFNLPEGHLISDHPTADWLKDKEIERLQNERNELAQGQCTHEEHEANETWLIQRLKEQGIPRDPARPVECPKCGWIPEPCPKS